MKFCIMRHPCIPEDEKMPHLIKVVDTKKEAEDWIKEQEGEYFKPSDYYIGKLYEPRG